MGDEQLHVIDLDQPRTGYRKFLSCIVRRDEDLTFIVDPGPRSTAGHLLASLKQLGVKKIDLILLTHIHLDHGGCVAEVIDAFPGARVFCHEIGAKHVAYPSKLWKGSQMVLGEVAEMYGRPHPVPESCMIDAVDLELRDIQVIPTPGHAPHHVSFLHDGVLYAGEALGTTVPLPSGKLYLRPATPPKFFLEQALESLDEILALEREPRLTVFAHYGVQEGAFFYAVSAREQLKLWVDTVSELVAESTANLQQRLFDRLMEIDPLYGQGRFEDLDEDIQQRERSFLKNTLDGILGYIKRR
jgi:glyoxylase-like metal-dependent hydrolase (beta-lactamase superfamily II)